MLATAAHPARGSFVREQLSALRRVSDVEVELHEFAPGGGSALAYLTAAREIQRKFRGQRFDVVHAHFGLTAWAALGARAHKRVLTVHGSDVRNPRSRRITLAAAPRYDLISAVSSELAQLIPGAGTRRTVAILPVGISLDRFKPIDRAQAREHLGLQADGRFLLFCDSPARAGKRYDLAAEVAAASGAQLLTLGGVAPDEVPFMHNAANAVLVPSDGEGFGLAVLEALACDVPVIATPTGVHPVALSGIPGTLCAPYDRQRWCSAVAPHLQAADPRVEGRARAALFSSDAMARRVVVAWSELLGATP